MTSAPSVCAIAAAATAGMGDVELLDAVAPFMCAPADVPALRSLLRTYDVRGTASQILSAGFSRVALQFPDVYLPDAPAVCAALSALLGDDALVFVLGDTSYGACCADEVAAQHLAAEAIVHYGHACLSPTRALPVLHVFPRDEDSADCEHILAGLRRAVRAVADQSPDARRVVVLYDVELAPLLCGWAPADAGVAPLVEVARPRAGDLRKFVEPIGDDASATQDAQDNDDGEGYVNVGALRFPSGETPLSESAVLWVCASGVDDALPAALRNAALRLATGLEGSCLALFRAGPDGETAIVNGLRLLRLRAREVGRARAAERIGVVAASLAVAGVTAVIERVVRTVEAAGKRAYVLLVGKVSPPKLLNFEEMDAFVLVACPLRAFVDAKEFLVPVLTPWEIKVALGDGELYDALYCADFREMGDEQECAAVSGVEETALTERAELKVAVAAPGGAAAFYKDRAWKGLVREKGGMDEDTPLDELSTKVVRGSSGIAMRYNREIR